ncbi:MAG: NAD(P)H-hydrate dehydratase [Planctomycetota bacterium]|jgi:NAD(P)H-hydrate epimerase
MVTRTTKVPRLAARDPLGHKGTYGTVGLLCGSEGMLGAAILAARGALRGGAGLVRACLPETLMAPLTVAVPAATTLARTVGLDGLLEDVDALVVGPGLGTRDEARQQVQQVLRSSTVPTVLDADGLNLIAPLQKTVGAKAPVVLTPHPGEAGRLLQRSSADVQSDREAAAVELAERSRQICVLKGAGTLVTDGERLYANQTGNPGLASGGTGDVLAGLMGALLAQGMVPFDAACLAVHVHGRAGDLVAEWLSPAGLTAEDLPLAIAEVMADVTAEGKTE